MEIKELPYVPRERVGIRTNFHPICHPLEGAWRLMDIRRFREDTKNWRVPLAKLWGPKEVVFENGTVTIHTPHDAQSGHYDYFPHKRYLLFNGVLYFISDLTKNRLVVHISSGDGPLRYTFERIAPTKIHEKTVLPSLSPSDLLGLWWVDAEYERTGSTWRLKTDYRQKPGLTLWDMPHFPFWAEYNFGQSPQSHGDSYYGMNFPNCIVRLSQNWHKSLFFYRAKDAQGNWAYMLDSMTGDYRDSRTKLHLTYITPAESSLFVKSLWWAESERHQAAAVDKIPIELLQAWCIPNPQELTQMLVEGKFAEHPEEYRIDEYAGVYVFLHYFTIYMNNEGKDSPLDLATTYLHFHENLRLWLNLYDQRQTVKLIYLFRFRKYPEQLAILRKMTLNIDSN